MYKLIYRSKTLRDAETISYGLSSVGFEFQAQADAQGEVWFYRWVPANLLPELL